MSKAFDADELVKTAKAEGIPFRATSPPSVDLIGKAEEALGFRLPEDYLSFVNQFGMLSIAGIELFGITSSDFVNSGIPNAIWITLREREDSGMPANYLIFSNSGYGGYYALELSSSEASSNVVEWTPGQMKVGEQGISLNKSFEKFCIEQITDAIEYW